jgi:hypothetical protein
MESKYPKAMNPAQRACLARTRIAAACRGEQTSEFRQWKKRTTVVSNEILAGKRGDREIRQRASARQHAWVEVEREFCGANPDRASEMLGFRARTEERRPLIDDVRWAYSHAMVYTTTEFDAPSAGAWLWLLEARENRSQFLGKLFALEQATHGGKLPKKDEGEVPAKEKEEEPGLEDFFGMGKGR